MGAPLLLAFLLASPAVAGPVLRPSGTYAPASQPATLLNLAPAAGVYERRGVGLLAVDLKDSTALHLDLGTRRAHALTGAVLDFAADAARRFDGTVVRRMGDGYLMAFPEAERALRAAAAIQKELPAWREAAGAPAVELRSAVHAGRVLVDASGARPEVYGQSVERVLALADRSAGGVVAMEPGLEERFRLLSPDAPAPAADVTLARPPVTVVQAATMFASLVDWPAVFERHGRRRAYATVKAFHAHVAAAAARHGGSVVKTSGDTVMATFPTPSAAVAAGLEIQARLGDLRRASPLGRLIAARVGISAGRALREEGPDGPDYFGNTVNAAARLMKRADNGEVLVSAHVLDAADASPREAMTLKGFHYPVNVARMRPAPAPADPAEAARLRRVARDAVAAVPPRE